MTYMTDLPTLMVWAVNSHPHDLASKSHDESENLEIAGIPVEIMHEYSRLRN